MLKSQELINKICAKISCGGLTDLETCQANNALTFLSDPIVSVTTFNNLPDIEQYTGRLIYVDDENRYYYSTGIAWLSSLDSQPLSYASVIWASGTNVAGELGNNLTTNTSSPVSVVGGFTDWCQVSSGGFNTNFRAHSLAVRTNGTAWGWGYGARGAIGHNLTTNTSSPVSVVGGFTDWCQVDTGQCHSVGVRTGGTAMSWGNGGNGRLGDGTITSRSSPVTVLGGSVWCQVSAGQHHSLGVRTDGTAWGWGCGGGRVGDNTSLNRSSPVAVVGGFTNWCQVSGGYSHSLGVRTDGTSWGWGTGNSGQIGHNLTTNTSSPVSVVGGFTDWCQLSAGSSHSLGLRTDGTAWAWGFNNSARLGDGFVTNRSSPVSVIGGFTDWCQVSAGDNHSFGIRINGTAWGWGFNGAGQLGTNSTTSGTSPTQLVGGFTDWCQVSGGMGTTHLIRQISKGL